MAKDGTPVLVAMLPFDVEVELFAADASSCESLSSGVDPCSLESIFANYFDEEFSREFESRLNAETGEELYSPFRRVVVNYNDPNGSIDCDRRRLLLPNSSSPQHQHQHQHQPHQPKNTEIPQQSLSQKSSAIEEERAQRRRGQGVDCEVVHSYGGFSIFTKTGGKPLPNTNIVASVQLQAFEDVDSRLLRTVQASLDPPVLSVSVAVSSNSNPDTPPTSTDNGGGGGVDTVILVAIVVAALSMILLAMALFLAFRRKRKDTYYATPSATMSSSGALSPVNSTPRPSGMAAPGQYPTETSRAVPIGSGDTLDGFQNDESPYSQTRGGDNATQASTANSGLYPESVISADIASSLNAYEKQFQGRANAGPATVTSASVGQQSKSRAGDSTVNDGVDDSRSESSMASSAYGYSLDGYASSVAQSTQYGY